MKMGYGNYGTRMDIILSLENVIGKRRKLIWLNISK
jgi:hypothetical protein